MLWNNVVCNLRTMTTKSKRLLSTMAEDASAHDVNEMLAAPQPSYPVF